MAPAPHTPRGPQPAGLPLPAATLRFPSPLAHHPDVPPAAAESDGSCDLQKVDALFVREALWDPANAQPFPQSFPKSWFLL